MRGKFRRHGHLFIGKIHLLVADAETISALSPIGSKSRRIATNLERDELGRLRVRYELGSRAARIGDVGL
jgi:hypothetical protein